MRVYSCAIVHMENFLVKEYPDYDSSSIIDAFAQNKVNVYEFLDGFVSYIQAARPGISSITVTSYVIAIKSYFAYHDIDVIPYKFKRKVMMPRIPRESEQPIDSSDLRTILLSCSNRRLKAYLLVLGSSGARATEALAIRNKDIDFSVSPVRIHLRKEFTKTKVGRDIYISDEATRFLKQYLDYKYKNPEKPREYKEDDLVFTVYPSKSPGVLYHKVWLEFKKLLTTVKMDKRKESGIAGRHCITLHSIRRMVKTIIATQTNTDYSEFYLGHTQSPYWTMKEPERREIYRTKCMPFLTVLDYGALENTSRGIVSQLEQKEKEIAYLRERDLKHELEMKAMNDRLAAIDGIVNKIDKLEKELGIKI